MSVKRRPNGDGSYFEKNGRHYYQAPRVPSTGKRPTVSARTKRELGPKRKALEARLAAPQVSTETLNAFLDLYFQRLGEDIAQGRGRIRETTYRNNQGGLKPLRALLGDTPLAALKLQSIEDAVRVLSQTYKPSTIHRAHAVLHHALETAVRWELIPKNPSVGVHLPPLDAAEVDHLSLDELHAILALPDRLHALWHLLAFSGMRIGEALALRWEDLDGSRLTISGTLVPDYQGGLKRNPPKSAKGFRTIDLDDDMIASLDTHRTAQNGEKMASSAMWGDSGYIFTTAEGGPLWNRCVARAWKRVCSQVTEKHVTPHGLRHTNAMLHLGYLGTSDYKLSRLLGHATVRFTQEKYGHLPVDAFTEDAIKMGQLLRSAGC